MQGPRTPRASFASFHTGCIVDAQSIPVSACPCCRCHDVPLSWLLALCSGREGPGCDVVGQERSSESPPGPSPAPVQDSVTKPCSNCPSCLQDFQCCSIPVLREHEVLTPYHQQLLYLFFFSLRLPLQPADSGISCETLGQC